MTPEFRVEPAEDADLRAAITAWARCGGAAGGPSGFDSRVISEYLRHSLAAFHAGGSPVHVHRLLGSVRSQLRDRYPVARARWWVDPETSDAEAGVPDEPEDILLQTLKQLEFVGDVGHAGGGYYLPAPVRAVKMPSGGRVILGGRPAVELDGYFGVPVGWAGLARALTSAEVERATSTVPWQTLRDWSGRPDTPLAEWTEALLTTARAGLADSPGGDPASFHIYAPYAFPRRGQSNRWATPRDWAPLPGSPSSTLYLCRTVTRPRRFWLAPLRTTRGVAGFRHEYVVPQRDSRRLMYGLDLVARAPTIAATYEPSSGVVELRLFSWLPREEHRIMTALGTECGVTPDSPIPWYRFSTAWRGDGEGFLSALGVVIRPIR